MKEKEGNVIAQEMYTTKMVNDYFKLNELEKKTGLLASSWGAVVVKELIDNALDAVEGNEQKEVTIHYEGNNMQIFDNGSGLSIDNIKSFYNFENYVSRNRHIITPSRGKQGNGLKTIIGISYLKGYELLWHTSDGIILKALVDAEMVADEDLKVEFIEVGQTNYLGVEVRNIPLNNMVLLNKIGNYSKCNPDVNFNSILEDQQQYYEAIEPVKDKSKKTSLSFYSWSEYSRLVKVQPPDETYKNFLGNYFTIREKNESKIKSKIANLNYDDVELDFYNLKSTLNTKPYTLLRKHLVGFEKSIEVSIQPDSNTGESIPCLVEFTVSRTECDRKKPIIYEYINNSPCYFNGESLCFSYRFCKINNNTKKAVYAKDLITLLEEYKNYIFDIHVISPYLKLSDYGKTEIDISDFADQLVDELRKAINKESKKYSSTKGKKPSKKSLAEKYMDEAFLIASSNGKHNITARQMWYKLRELANREDPTWEGSSTYREFTQTWLTSWIDEHEDDYAEKINFSDRGNFYIDKHQTGLGSANVREFIRNIDNKSNAFTVWGSLENNIRIESRDFNLLYKYDKAIFVEKTGFDDIFRSERLDEKYNAVIVSGQGFATRAAKTLLHTLKQHGLKLYCIHDLDVNGVNIYNSLLKANEKFKYDIDIVDLGITLDDVKKYNIEPENVSLEHLKSSAKNKRLAEARSLSYEFQKFFINGDNLRRVEINAFTTEQLLELIDDKLGNVSNLPKVNISQSLSLDNDTLCQVAFMQLMAEKHKPLLSEISRKIGDSFAFDLSKYDGEFTLFEAEKKMPEIETNLIQQFKLEIMKHI